MAPTHHKNKIKNPNMKIPSTLALGALSLAASAVIAIAQETPRPPQPNEPARRPDGGGDRRGGFNVDEFRKRMAERMKTTLKVTDEEWAALQPLIEKVQEKQRDAMAGRFGFPGGGPGGPGGGRPGGDARPGGEGRPPGGEQGPRPDRPGSAESEALRTAVESETTAPADLTAKLTAVREQRKKAQAELATAREDLKKALTLRQEAALVAMGILE